MMEIIKGIRSQPDDPLAISNGELPRLIPIGDGRGFQITREGDELISALAQQLHAHRPSLVKTVTEKEWRGRVRSTIGQVLAKLDPQLPLNAQAGQACSTLESHLDAEVAGLPAREHAFGVTLFSDPDVQAFSIGPVRFEPRSSWLDRKTKEGGVSQTTATRVLRAWKGERLRPRKSSYDAIRERDILDAIGSCLYVCSVETSGFGTEASQRAAATAARLAICSVALLWQVPSDALKGMRMRWDGEVYSRRSLSFVPGKIVPAGQALTGNPFGTTVSAEDWAKTCANAAGYFAACGETLEFYLSKSGQAPRSSLMNALAQALLWFHAGCREESDQMATVYLNATLDALGGGRKAKGILKVIEARLGASPETEIHKDGPTFKKTVEDIYSDGRSRTVHGTSGSVGHDWFRTRALAEELARLVLAACLDWAGRTPTAIERDHLGE